MAFSIIKYYGKESSRCGYCKGLNCSVSHGMYAYTMNPRDYQDLIDRGWRRSGHYCYKLENRETCCPCYTVRCNALEFKLSKSHKKILKRMNRFLRDGKKDKNEEMSLEKNDPNSCCSIADTGGGINDEPKAPDVPIKEIDIDAVVAIAPVVISTSDEVVDLQIGDNINVRSSSKNTTTESHQPCKTAKPPCKKAKQIRLERRQAKLAAKGVESPAKASDKMNSNKEKTLSDYITDISTDDKHKLKLKLVHAKSDGFQSTLEKTYDLFEKYQRRVHNDPPKNVDQYLNFLQRSPIKVELVKTSGSPNVGYGSFHQQYWLDDKLIAVAVLDILPFCVSSVYFFYDPDYSFLSLGTYGSLREINLIQELATHSGNLKYYYMGFYIHSCPKMRYKGKLNPSFLLCPETYTWIPLDDEVRCSLDQEKYQRLNRDLDKKDENETQGRDLDAVLLLTDSNTHGTYQQYVEITGDFSEREMILEYSRLVGKPCAHRMIYVNF